MTLNAGSAAMRAACAAQLYDEWHGYYILQRLNSGAYIDVRRLSRDEAMTYRTQSDEVLELVWNQPIETIAPNSPSNDVARAERNER